MTPRYIICHHSLTKDGRTVSWDNIRNWHIRHNGWSAIGYHFGIEMVDGAANYEILMGRMPDRTGAHCIGYNRKSLGICFVGNFDTGPVPYHQWRTGVRLAASLCRIFKISPAKVIGHREAAKDGRTCPGNHFDLDYFRKRISEHV